MLTPGPDLSSIKLGWEIQLLCEMFRAISIDRVLSPSSLRKMRPSLAAPAWFMAWDWSPALYTPPAFFYFFFFLIFFFKFFLFIYDSHRERERGRDTGGGRSRLHAPGAWCGIRSRVSRIAPWAKGRAKPLRHPGIPRTTDLGWTSNSYNVYRISKNPLWFTKLPFSCSPTWILCFCNIKMHSVPLFRVLFN